MNDLADQIREFADARDWHQFHSPKNLAMALAVEAAEILEHFQWLTEEQSRDLEEEQLAKVRDELGDVLIYLVRLSDVLGVDLLKAAEDKLEKNAEKYPVDKVKGKALKYSDYHE